MPLKEIIYLKQSFLYEVLCSKSKIYLFKQYAIKRGGARNIPNYYFQLNIIFMVFHLDKKMLNSRNPRGKKFLNPSIYLELSLSMKRRIFKMSVLSEKME